MHASSDIRLVKCFDGLHYSFELLEHIYSSLHEVCLQVTDCRDASISAYERGNLDRACGRRANSRTRRMPGH